MSKFLNLLRNLHDPVAALITVAVLILSGWFLPILIPGAGTFDMGILQFILLGLVILTVSSAAAWVLLHIHFPKFFEALQNEATTESSNQILKTKCEISSAFFMGAFFYVLYLLLAAALQVLTLYATA